jgi:hypothetical protein
MSLGDQPPLLDRSERTGFIAHRADLLIALANVLTMGSNNALNVGYHNLSISTIVMSLLGGTNREGTMGSRSRETVCQKE